MLLSGLPWGSGPDESGSMGEYKLELVSFNDIESFFFSMELAGPHNNWYYNPKLKGFARQLRNNSTAMEIRLWSEVLRKGFMGYSFNRQRPVLTYIADFMCKRP